MAGWDATVQAVHWGRAVTILRLGTRAVAVAWAALIVGMTAYVAVAEYVPLGVAKYVRAGMVIASALVASAWAGKGELIGGPAYLGIAVWYAVYGGVVEARVLGSASLVAGCGVACPAGPAESGNAWAAVPLPLAASMPVTPL
jgi:hypothetical protein